MRHPVSRAAYRSKNAEHRKSAPADFFMSGSNMQSSDSSEGERNATWMFSMNSLPRPSVCMLAVQEYWRPFSLARVCVCPIPPKGCLRPSSDSVSPMVLRLVPPETSGALPVGDLGPTYEEPCFRSHKLSWGHCGTPRAWPPNSEPPHF